MQTTLKKIGDPEGFIFDSSLVLYLPLYELDGSSFMSKDAYGHLCTVTGALLYPLRGRWFDGSDDKIACGNSTAFNATEITVEMWVRPSSGTPGAVMNIAGHYSFKNDGWVLKISDTPNIGVEIHWAGDRSNSTTPIWTPDGAWHQIAFTYKETTVNIFRDGNLITTASTTAMVVATRTLEISETTKTFNDLIGEFRHYNRVLTPLEIQHNYLATKWRYQ